MLNRLFPVVAIMATLALPSNARLICSTATTSSNTGNCYVRTTNPPTADLWSVGAQLRGGVPVVFTEITVDATGSLLPTSQLGTQDLGSSSFPWENVYTTVLTNTGNQVTGSSGTTSASGVGGTAPTQLINNGLDVRAKVQIGTASGQTTGVNVSTIVPVNSPYETVISSGGAIVLTSTPNISTTTVVGGSTEIPSGTMLVISSTATASVTFQDAGTLTGSQLQLGSTTRAVSQFKTLTLIYDATDHFWREIAYGNN